MARLPRIVVPGQLHLIAQAAQGEVPVFDTAAMRQRYLGLLRDASREAAVLIHAYGLADHELRLLATPSRPESLARMMQAIGRRAVPGINHVRRAAGSPWAGRFRSAVVETPARFLEVLRFVEKIGPVFGEERLRLDRSSVAHHLGREQSEWLAVHAAFFRMGNTPFEREVAYGRFLETTDMDRSEDDAIRHALRGWVLGSSQFTESVAGQVDRPLAERRPGRPRRQPTPTGLSPK